MNDLDLKEIIFQLLDRIKTLELNCSYVQEHHIGSTRISNEYILKVLDEIKEGE